MNAQRDSQRSVSQPSFSRAAISRKAQSSESQAYPITSQIVGGALGCVSTVCSPDGGSQTTAAKIKRARPTIGQNRITSENIRATSAASCVHIRFLPPGIRALHTISPVPANSRPVIHCLPGTLQTPRALEVRLRLLTCQLITQFWLVACRWWGSLVRVHAPKETPLRVWAARRRTTTLNVVYYVSRTTTRVKGLASAGPLAYLGG